MLRNYFTVALRNLLRGKMYSFINIFGLAIGIACVVLVTLFVQYEYSYDTHFKNPERLYRVPTTLGSYQTFDAPLPLAGVMKERFTDVEAVTRLTWMEPPYPYFNPTEENHFQEKNAYYADSSFFEVFGIALAEGDSKTALSQAQSVVLSASTAKRYFGNENAINKTVRLDNKKDLKVTGVFGDFPHNSHIHPDILISAVSNRLMTDYSNANWEWLYSSSTYVLLKGDAHIEKINTELKDLFFKVTGYTREQYNADYSMYLQPVLDIHLKSHYPGENNGNINVLYTFGVIGFVIILIATINFMNLSTVRSLSRAREVGMRKVLGGQRKSLIIQFLTESIATVFLSGVAACLISYFALSGFNRLIGTNLTLASVLSFQNSVIFFLFIVLLGVGAGFYPAFFLSGFNPALVLKGKFSKRGGSIWLRKTLVVTQFTIGFVVLAGTIIINGQLDFMIQKDLGYTKEQIVTLELPNDSIGVDRIRDEMMRLPNVKTASKMSESFNNVQGWWVPWYEGAPPQNDFSVTRFHTDHNFKDLAELKLVAGRFFNEDFRGDSSSFVLNETAIKKLGWKAEEAIGKQFGNENTPGKVIGVVRDFNFRHLSTPISSFVFSPPRRKTNAYEKGRIAIKLENSKLAETMFSIEKKWSELVLGWPLKYSYMGDDIAQQYQSEIKLSKLTQVFSVLAILISILGLFGLASFSIAQRTREIGIRKVLGAEVKSLIFITTKDFAVLICTGIIIGVPLAYLSAAQWLNEYAYKITISPVPFIMAMSISFFIAVLTVAVVAYRAANSNPVNSLKQE